jgi:hypothetical protein
VRPWEVLRRPDPGSEPGADFIVDVSRFSGRKEAALKAHRTQHLSLDRIFFSKPDVARLLGVEMFRQAFGPPLASRPAADVFDGIDFASEERFHEPCSSPGAAAARRS